MRKEILVVGSLNMDMVIKMDRMPALGETVLGKELSYIPGGKGANQAYAAGRLGGKVTMLGCLGEDEFGKIQRENLSAAGVDMSRIKTGDKMTGAAVIFVNSRGDNSISVIQGANLECDISYIQSNEDLLRRCEYVMLQMEVPYETIFYVVEKAREYGKTVILNPAPAPELDVMTEDIYQKLDYITPNERELARLSGLNDISEESLKEGAKLLIKRGVKNVIVTLGDKGALLVNQNGVRKFEARKVEAVDTTAAGDCFNGAFVMALADGYGMEKAIEFANAAASLSVSRAGAQSSIPDIGEVKAVYNIK